MPAEIRQATVTSQQWPCGPECTHAQPMPNTYGDWHWCNHPQFGGRMARDGHECSHYNAANVLPGRSRSSPSWG